MKNIFKIGSTVLFQGDSITDCGRSRTDLSDLGGGYAKKVAEIYNILFPDSGVNFVNRGVSGNRAIDLLARYDEDFKAVKPDFISIMIGVNDTWRRYDNNDPTTAEEYEKNYRTLLEKLKSDFPKIKIMIIEPYLLDSDEAKMCFKEDLLPKVEVARKLAREYADIYLPIGGLLTKYATTDYTPSELAHDGIHPTPQGHGVIAVEYLRALDII